MTAHDFVEETVMQLRTHSDEVESSIEKQLKALERLNKRFTYLYNLKENGVRLYEEVRKESPQLVNNLAGVTAQVVKIENYDLAEGSRVYQQLKEKEVLLNRKVTQAVKDKERFLDKELEKVGKKFHEARKSFTVELEKFRFINDKIQDAYAGKKVEVNNIDGTVYSPTESSRNTEESKQKEVLSTEQLILRKLREQQS